MSFRPARRVSAVARESTTYGCGAGLPARVVRQRSIWPGTSRWKYGSPRDRHPKAGRRRRVGRVERREARLELTLRVASSSRPHTSRRHLVMERRHEHLDPVRLDDLIPSRRCCSRNGAPRRRASAFRRVSWSTSLILRRRRRRRPRRPPPAAARLAHQLALGRKRTSEASPPPSYCRTCWPVSGGATCSDSV